MTNVILATNVINAHIEWTSEVTEKKVKGRMRMESFARRYCSGAPILSRKENEVDRARDIKTAEDYLKSYCSRDLVLSQELEGRENGRTN